MTARATWLSLAVAGAFVSSLVQAETYFEVSGKVAAEARYFTEEAAYRDQSDGGNLSALAEPQFLWEWSDGDDRITFVPFARVDQWDDERTHADIRELNWLHVGEEYELRVGLGKVFWGVTEFQHLVDTINQTDGVEDIDGEDKLGQPMISVSSVRDWGIIDLFVLPGFRERTFASEEGRPGFPIKVDTDRARYQSDDEDRHIDLAARWSNSFDVYDVGVHVFRGTNRDPQLQSELRSGQPILVPYYALMTQVGVDVQATIDSWLWKFESRYRNVDPEDFTAVQFGFEYTLYGLFDSATDLGLLTEYGWDERGTDATDVGQNDLYLGGRITLNDAADSQLLAGISRDLDYDSTSVLVEASRRFGSNWKVSLDGRFFSADDQRDTAYAIRKDDHIQLTGEYYF